MSGSRRKPVCAYCGQHVGTTRDHVPPKGLFAKPRPSLITVPCCEQCRNHQSLDDEYFVRMVSMKSGTADNPSANAARDSALRSLTKPAKRRFSSALLSSTKDLAVHSAAGIYLGQKMSYDVDLGRLCNVIQRTTRGIYFHEFGQRLPDDHRCKAYALDGFDLAAPEILAQLRKLWGHAASGERKDLGENVFTYWMRKIAGPEGATAWDFVLYGSVAFLAFTGPKASPSAESSTELKHD
jgi:hypothetical protein